MNDAQAIEHASDKLRKVRQFYSKDAGKRFSRDRDYIACALLDCRAAKTGGAKGLIARWNKFK